MLTLLALLAALLGPGPIMADNSGGGPVTAAVVPSDVSNNGTPKATADSDVSAGPVTINVTVDDNSGGGPVTRK